MFVRDSCIRCKGTVWPDVPGMICQSLVILLHMRPSQARRLDNIRVMCHRLESPSRLPAPATRTPLEIYQQVLVRLTTCKRFIKSLPKLSLATGIRHKKKNIAVHLQDISLKVFKKRHHIHITYITCTTTTNSPEGWKLCKNGQLQICHTFVTSLFQRLALISASCKMSSCPRRGVCTWTSNN